MFMLRHLMLTTLLAVSAGFSTQATAAANIGVSPTQINLSPSSKTGMVTLLNKGDTPVNLQIDSKSWDMDENGKFIETDNSDFIFYPKTLTIKPHEQASIRVGYTSNFPQTEKPYRLFIEEIPDITQVNAERSGLKIGLVSALRLSMPLYVVPVNDIPAAQIELGGLKTDKNTLRIGVKNLTAYHVDVKRVAVKLLKQDKVLTEKSVDLKLQRVLGDRMVFINLPMDVKNLCNQADALAVEIEVGTKTPAYQTKVALKSGCQL